MSSAIKLEGIRGHLNVVRQMSLHNVINKKKP